MSDTWYVGSWRVNLGEHWIARRHRIGAQRIHPDARLLSVLKVLIDHAGETVTTDTLLETAWPDRVVGRDSVTTAIYQLRQLLGDTRENPRYITSDTRRGYRLVAPARQKSKVRVTWIAACATATAMAVIAWGAWHANPETPFLYVEPIANFADSPVTESLFTAIESTLLSELIQTVPGRVRTDDKGDSALRLQSMMVQCDLGPTLVMRLLNTAENTYIWSEAYNLDEAAESPGRPTLVEQVAMDVGAAMSL